MSHRIYESSWSGTFCTRTERGTLISCHATPNMGSVRHSHELRTRALGLCLQHRIWKAAIIGALFKWWSVLLLKRFFSCNTNGDGNFINNSQNKEIIDLELRFYY